MAAAQQRRTRSKCMVAGTSSCRCWPPRGANDRFANWPRMPCAFFACAARSLCTSATGSVALVMAVVQGASDSTTHGSVRARTGGGGGRCQQRHVRNSRLGSQLARDNHHRVRAPLRQCSDARTWFVVQGVAAAVVFKQQSACCATSLGRSRCWQRLPQLALLGMLRQRLLQRRWRRRRRRQSRLRRRHVLRTAVATDIVAAGGKAHLRRRTASATRSTVTTVRAQRGARMANEKSAITVSHAVQGALRGNRQQRWCKCRALTNEMTEKECVLTPAEQPNADAGNTCAHSHDTRCIAHVGFSQQMQTRVPRVSACAKSETHLVEKLLRTGDKRVAVRQRSAAGRLRAFQSAAVDNTDDAIWPASKSDRWKAARTSTRTHANRS